MTEGSRGEGSQKEEIMAFEHISVLLYETVDGLNVKPDGIYVDATLGGGGHAYEVCSRLGSQGRLIGIMLRGESHDSQEQLLRYEAAAPETGH